MLPFGIAESGGVLIEHAVADPHRLFHDLTAFGRCVERIAAAVSTGRRAD